MSIFEGLMTIAVAVVTVIANKFVKNEKDKQRVILLDNIAESALNELYFETGKEIWTQIDTVKDRLISVLLQYTSSKEIASRIASNAIAKEAQKQGVKIEQTR